MINIYSGSSDSGYSQQRPPSLTTRQICELLSKNLIFHLTKALTSLMATISWQIEVALLERELLYIRPTRACIQYHNVDTWKLIHN